MAEQYQECADELSELIQRTFRELEALVRPYAQLLAAGPPNSADLRRLDAAIDELLTADHDLLGAGVVVQPGFLADHERYLQWRQRQPDGGLAPLVLDVDSTGDDPYDYPDMEWFRIPQQEDRRMVSGPYFDYLGSERCALTYAVPVVVDGQFRGIAGADQLVSQLEATVLPVLRRIPTRAALLNHERRVVTANTPSLVTGERLPMPVFEQAEKWPVAGDQQWWLVVPAQA